MAEKIRPALTPEEWAHEAAMLNLFEPLPQDPPDLTPAELVRAMALANHALPDGHPLKFTKADVRRIRESVYFYKRSDLFHLAARISALLPPEASRVED